jgi:hypothetical protein
LHAAVHPADEHQSAIERRHARAAKADEAA